jgi:hypothetical protein
MWVAGREGRQQFPVARVVAVQWHSWK